jgi:hypothetical protein
MIDFAANAWGDLLQSSLMLVAIAARTAFAVFLVNALLLLIAYLSIARLGQRLTLALNLAGVLLFLGGTLIVGRLLGRAFTLEAPESGNPPDDVGLFFALAAFGLLALGLMLVLAAAAPLARQLRARWQSYQEQRKLDEEKSAAETEESQCPE